MFIQAKLSELKPYKQPSFILVVLAALATLVGSSVYFALPVEPSVAVLLAVSTCCAVISYFYKRSMGVFYSFYFAFWLMGSLTWVAYTIQGKETFILSEKHNNGRFWVVGQLSEMKSYAKRSKLLLSHAYIYGVENEQMPDDLNIKLSISNNRLEDFDLGDWMAVEAKLFSPKTPEYDEGYDFRLNAWLQNVSAVGYAFGDVYKTSWPEGWNKSNYHINKARKKITQMVVGYAEKTGDDNQSERGVMAALITGNRSFIPQNVYDAYRESGMAHLLAISGLHIGLVTGLIFILFRRIIGSSVRVVHAVNTKKIAAVFAIAGALMYMLLAGSTLPTIRSVIMVSIMLMAMLFSRLSLTLRAFCMTVIVVLFTWPESVISPSFQMSFVAVFCLLLWAEKARVTEHINSDFNGVSFDVFKYFQAVVLTSFVAGLATLPIAAWHFGSVSLSGVFTNIFAIPLTAFLIMPLALLSLLLMPLGLQEIPLKGMEFAVFCLNNVAFYGQDLVTSGLPILHHAKWTLVVGIPLVLLCFLCLRQRYALLSLPFLFVAYFVDASLQKESIYISKNNTSAVLLLDEPYLLYGEENKGLSYFVKNYYGEEKDIRLYEDFCDSEGCFIQLNNEKIYVLTNEHSGISDSVCYENNFVLAPNILHSETCESLFSMPKNAMGAYIYSENDIQYKKQANNRVWHQ